MMLDLSYDKNSDRFFWNMTKLLVTLVLIKGLDMLRALENEEKLLSTRTSSYEQKWWMVYLQDLAQQVGCSAFLLVHTLSMWMNYSVN